MLSSHKPDTGETDFTLGRQLLVHAMTQGMHAVEMSQGHCHNNIDSISTWRESFYLRQFAWDREADTEEIVQNKKNITEIQRLEEENNVVIWIILTQL